MAEPMTRPTWKRAFTLIELLIVIIIIAVMAAVVIPSYVRYLSHVRFQGKVREVQDIFGYAREQAVTLDTTVTLHFDQQSESFSAEVTPPPKSSDEPSSFTSNDNTGGAMAQTTPDRRVVQLDSSQSVRQFSISGTLPGTSSSNTTPTPASSPSDLHFLSDGTVEGMTMTLSSATGASADFTLWPSTARLTMDSELGIR
jgi:prepilin-type N-terminal cleavage/methylation domain-containing protein